MSKPREDKTASLEQREQARARYRAHRSKCSTIRSNRPRKVRHGGGLLVMNAVKSGGRTKRFERRERQADLYDANVVLTRKLIFGLI